MKHWAHTNSTEDDARRIINSIKIHQYGLSGKHEADASYPDDIDARTPLEAEMLTDY